MTSASASRVTRSSRSLRHVLLLFAGALAVAGVLRAQETAPTAPAAPAATGRSEAPPAAGEPATVPAGESGPPSAKGRSPANAGPTPGRFEPTEKVRADFDVAFPVDI
jgi:hypothetical protein